MSTDANKAILVRLIAALHRGTMDIVDEGFAPDFALYPPLSQPAARAGRGTQNDYPVADRSPRRARDDRRPLWEAIKWLCVGPSAAPLTGRLCRVEREETAEDFLGG